MKDCIKKPIKCQLFTKLTALIVLLIVTTMGLTACSKHEAKNTIRVGTIAGPETRLMIAAKRVALKRYGLHIKIVTFTDYNSPNRALNSGEIDANMFQHVPFLRSQKHEHGYNIIPIGKVFLYPMGLYSKKLTSLQQLKPGSEIAIPNDPSNEARALLLLQSAKLIRLKPGIDINATPIDILQNPLHLRFIELGAAQLPRALQDVAISAINTNYAIPSGLHPKSALFLEKRDSPYVNVVVVRAQDRHSKKARELVAALHSKPVLKLARKIFGPKGAIPGWKES